MLMELNKQDGSKSMMKNTMHQKMEQSQPNGSNQQIQLNTMQMKMVRNLLEHKQQVIKNITLMLKVDC